MPALAIALLVFWHLFAVAAIVLGIVGLRRLGAQGRQIAALTADVNGLRIQTATTVKELHKLTKALGWDDEWNKTRVLDESATRQRYGRRFDVG